MPHNDRIDDENCSRIIYFRNFNPQKDIYVSLETPLPNILTQSGKNILTEDSFGLVMENEFLQQTGFVTYLVNSTDAVSGVDLKNGEAGIGLGMMATTDTSFQNVSSHLVSVAVDVYGGYGLSGTFKESGSGGFGHRQPNTITCRASSENSEYDFLSSTVYDELTSSDIDVRALRFGFKNYLSKYTVDVKVNNEEYKKVFEAEYDFNVNDIPADVRIGFSSSGKTNLIVKNITYSGDAEGDAIRPFIPPTNEMITIESLTSNPDFLLTIDGDDTIVTIDSGRV